MSEMDEPNFFLEDLDDEGEEVDYEDFDLEDIESEDEAEGDTKAEADAVEEDGANGAADNLEEVKAGDAAGKREDGAKILATEPQAPGTDNSKTVEQKLEEALEKANAAASLSLSGRNQIPAPASSKQQQRPGSASKGKPVAPRGGAPAQRGRMGPRPGRGGPPGQQRNLPQPHSRGPTPPPRPSGGNMGVPHGLPMPPGMMLPGPMMGGPGRPMQMGAGPRPPPPGPCPPPQGHNPNALQSPDRPRGGMPGQAMPQPQPPLQGGARQPVHWQDPSGRGAPQHSGNNSAHMARPPAVLPMPPMLRPFQAAPAMQPHPLADRLGEGVRTETLPNGSGRLPTNLRSNGFNLALGMDAASPKARRPQGMQLLPQQQQAGIAPPSQRLQGRLGDAPKPAAVTGAPLLAPQDMAEQLRLREERQEAERARQRAKEEQEKKKAEELKAKKLEMARLQIKLQQMENRKNQLLLAAEERARKQREAAEFEAMKLRVMQLEQLVATSSAAAAAVGTSGAQALTSVPMHAAPTVALPAPANNADPSLQVDFDEDDDDDEDEASPAAQRKQPSADARLPQRDQATRDGAQKVIRSVVRPADRSKKLEERLGKGTHTAGARPERKEQQPTPADLPFRDLREFLAQKKRSRQEDEENPDEGRSSAQTKKAASGGHRGAAVATSSRR